MAESIKTSDINNLQQQITNHQTATPSSAALSSSSSSLNSDGNVLQAVSAQTFQFNSSEATDSAPTTTWSTNVEEAGKKQFHREWFGKSATSFDGAASTDTCQKNQECEYNP